MSYPVHTKDSALGGDEMDISMRLILIHLIEG